MNLYGSIWEHVSASFMFKRKHKHVILIKSRFSKTFEYIYKMIINREVRHEINNKQ